MSSVLSARRCYNGYGKADDHKEAEAELQVERKWKVNVIDLRIAGQSKSALSRVALQLRTIRRKLCNALVGKLLQCFSCLFELGDGFGKSFEGDFG